MSFDITSFLIGQAASGGAGGGGDGGFAPAVWNAGYFGTGEMVAASSITVTLSGYRGKYALVTVAHRDAITPPSGCVLLDSSSYTSNTFTQYVSVFKKLIETDLESITFTQASLARIAATAWVISSDYSISKANTYEVENTGTTPFTVTSSDLTLVTFNAPTSQQSTDYREWAYSNGAWICTDDDVTTAHYYLRHFSGIIPAASSEKATIVQRATNNGIVVSGAQLVVYTIASA